MLSVYQQWSKLPTYDLWPQFLNTKHDQQLQNHSDQLRWSTIEYEGRKLYIVFSNNGPHKAPLWSFIQNASTPAITNTFCKPIITFYDQPLISVERQAFWVFVNKRPKCLLHLLWRKLPENPTCHTIHVMMINNWNMHGEICLQCLHILSPHGPSVIFHPKSSTPNITNTFCNTMITFHDQPLISVARTAFGVFANNGTKWPTYDLWPQTSDHHTWPTTLKTLWPITVIKNWICRENIVQSAFK